MRYFELIKDAPSALKGTIYEYTGSSSSNCYAYKSRYNNAEKIVSEATTICYTSDVVLNNDEWFKEVFTIENTVFVSNDKLKKLTKFLETL